MLETLRQARALLAQGWCQGSAAQFEPGQSVTYASPRARAWCVLGACWRLLDHDHETEWDVLAKLSFARHGNESLQALRDRATVWNDAPCRTQADVLARFDDAIRRLELRP